MRDEFDKDYWSSRGPVENGSYITSGEVAGRNLGDAVGLSRFQFRYLQEFSRACTEAWGIFSGGLLIPVINVSGGFASSPNYAPHSGGQSVSVSGGGLIVSRPFNRTFREFDFDKLSAPNGEYTLYLKHYNMSISNALLVKSLKWVRSWSWRGTITSQPDAGKSGWIQPPMGPPTPGSWLQGQIKNSTTPHTLGSGSYDKDVFNKNGKELYDQIISNISEGIFPSLKGEEDTYLHKHLKAISRGFSDYYLKWIDQAEWETKANGFGQCAVGGSVSGGKIFLGKVA